MNELQLSLVFPAYNEAERLPESLKKTVSNLSGRDYSTEIIVVDDGSDDGTADLALDVLKPTGIQHRVIRLGENRGKGFAVKTGLEAAAGRFVFFSDADLSTPIEELEKTLPCLEEGYDIVIGSRGMKESNVEVHQNPIREYGGRFFNLIVQLLVLPGIKDTQCGFKGFRREVILPITSRQKYYGFSFDVELLWIARNLGYKIAEIPVLWRNSPDTKVDVVRDSIRMILEVMKLRFVHKATDFSADKR